MMRDVLSVDDTSEIVRSISQISLDNIGSPTWFAQSESIQKLNIQSIHNSKDGNNKPCFVTELLIKYDKLAVLVSELVSTEIWNRNCVQHFLVNGNHNIATYAVSFYELSVINLLETILFHREAVESIEIMQIDLIDYCHRNMVTYLTEPSENQTNTGSGSASSQLILKLIPTVFYLVEAADYLVPSACTRLASYHDFVMIFARLIKLKPWIRLCTTNGRLEVNEAGGWVDAQSYCQPFHKLEALCWMCVHQLLLSKSFANKYNMDSYRLLCLQGHLKFLNEPLLSRIPVLDDLKRYIAEQTLTLDSKGFGEAYRTPQIIIMHPMKTVFDTLMEEYRSSGADLIETMKRNLEHCVRVAEQMWDNVCVLYPDSQHAAPPEGFCATCRSKCTKKCSRCLNVWYCGSGCQKLDWRHHRQNCKSSATES